MELHKICRICLKTDLLVSIFSPTFLLRPIEMIEKLSISYSKLDDNLPKFLCQSCLYRLLDAFNLQQLAAASERQLLQYLNETKDVITSNMQTNLVCKSLGGLPTETSDMATSFCNILQTRDIHSNNDDGADDLLNDVEIDVSSLTRSEGDDTLSEVFVDGHINCHYDAETPNFVDNIANDNSSALEEVFKSNTEMNNSTTARRKSRKSPKSLEKCNECGKTFNTPGYLALHQRIHTGEKPYKCKLCSRRFVQISNLRLHQQVHSGERRFQCEVCAKFFTTSSNLKAHSLTHKESRDFQCENCEKRFKSARELRRHEPIHKSNQENVCEFCQKAFAKRCYLSAHMQTVHRNLRRHKCKDCGKFFASQSNLQCHVRIHSGDKPFQCKHCTWKFNQSSALVRHMKKKHSEELTQSKDDSQSELLKSKEIDYNAQNNFEKHTDSPNLTFQLPPPAVGLNNGSQALAMNVPNLEAMNAMNALYGNHITGHTFYGNSN